MRTQFNPDSSFDCLFIAQCLQEEGDTFSAPELHMFSYLACLLWLYQRKAVSDWGYSFVGTELGAPFSRDIDTTITYLIQRGCFLKHHDQLYLADSAKQLLENFAQLTLNQDRKKCLRAACASTTAFSIGMVWSALAQEPELRRAHAIPSNRLLLEELAQSQLYAQFEALRRALNPESNDLRLPAIVWLGALYRSSESFAMDAE